MMKQVNIKIPFRMLGLLLGLFLSVGAFAQITVKGHVKDSQGEPIIGATIRIAGQSTGGTISDFDGNFTLQAKQGATLTISSVGYQQATATAAPSVVVTLLDDAQVLENVVVLYEPPRMLYVEDHIHGSFYLDDKYSRANCNVVWEEMNLPEGVFLKVHVD